VIVLRKVPASLPLSSLLAAVLFSGCASDSSVAVARSNQEAQRLYHVEPFKKQHGQWRSEGQQEVWEALTSYGGRDFTAKVVFIGKRAIASVNVQMLAHPGPEPFLQIGPEMLRERRSGIPEVMPK
jgi:hypothetical protein